MTQTSPEDLRTIADQAAQSIYGGRLSDQEMQHFVDQFHAQETAYQTAKYNAENQTTPGTVVMPPNPAGANAGNLAEQAVRQAHPEQVFTSAFGKTLSDMLPGLLGPGAGMLSG